MNSRRMNRLEELGRVDAEKAYSKKGKRNLKDEKSRIVRELKADGGKVRGKQKAQPKTPREQQRQRRMGDRSTPKGIKVIEVGKKDGIKLYSTEKKDGGKVKKKKENPMKEDRAKEGKKAQYRKMGFGKMMDKGEIKFAKGGSALKPVKPSQKGLKKLPTKVRNKMGYMKKGGRVGMGKAMRGGGCVR